jgi:hypothetical protein
VLACRCHFKGKCDKGDKCDFYHQPVCKFIKNGSCKEGSVNCCILDQRLLLQPRIPHPAAPKTTRVPKAKRNQSHRQSLEEQ